jgi:polar amino acid transport system substrate-binding protein
MKKLCKFISIIIIVFAFSVTAFPQKYLKKIQERNELRVGMTAKQPPFAIKTQEGKIIGYEAELAEMLANAMGVNLKIVEIPFTDLLNSLEDGKVDMVMSGMTMTIKRNMKTIFVGPHLLSGKSILFRSDFFSNTDEPQDLNNKNVNIVALKGSNSEIFVKKEIPNAVLTLALDYEEGIKMLEENKVQIMLADYPICAYTALIHPEKGLYTIDQPLTIEPIGVALPVDAAHFQNLVENFIGVLSLDGTLAEMQSYWFDSGEWIDQVKP